MMLEDSDLESLNRHLVSLTQEHHSHHKALQELFEQVHCLLDNYTSLKSDYEEVKEGREKYKRQARGQERNPFVLVLVDGDGYLFREHFLKAGSDGGVNAACELSDSIKELMHSTMGAQADQCRIMVRVYANILGLSKVLARAGLVGQEARSLSSFSSAFNRAQDLFDFVDAADKKEGSDFKIREIFRLFVDLNQCRHIYFAGCHDTGFCSLLTPYKGRSDRITLIKAASFHPDFEDLDLPIKELPSVFMSNSLTCTHSANTPSTKANNTKNGARQVCKHFQRGICKFGSVCNKQHVIPSPQIALPTMLADDALNMGYPMGLITGHTDEFFLSRLPSPTARKAEELIPINEDWQRLDTYSPCPSQDAFDEYNHRVEKHKVCNSYHVAGECDNIACQYDHSDVSDAIIEVLRYFLRQQPCPKAGACRSIKCYFGHLCQKPDCKGARVRHCRFNHLAHTMNLKLSQWVVPVDQPYNGPLSTSGHAIEE